MGGHARAKTSSGWGCPGKLDSRQKERPGQKWWTPWGWRTGHTGKSPGNRPSAGGLLHPQQPAHREGENFAQRNQLVDLGQGGVRLPLINRLPGHPQQALLRQAQLLALLGDACDIVVRVPGDFNIDGRGTVYRSASRRFCRVCSCWCMVASVFRFTCWNFRRSSWMGLYCSYSAWYPW